MKVNKLLITSIIACTLGTVGIGAGLYNYVQKQIDSPIVSTVDNSNGIRIKQSTSGKNSSGYDYITFSYSISPTNATKSISAFLKYIDGTNCSDVINSSVDFNAKTITLTCKQAFNKQIKLVVSIVDQPDIYAEALIDYERKAIGASYEGYGDYSFVSNGLNNKSFNLYEYININYGDVFTIDKTYNVDSSTVVIESCTYRDDLYDGISDENNNLFQMVLSNNSDNFGDWVCGKFTPDSHGVINLSADVLKECFTTTEALNEIIELDQAYLNGTLPDTYDENISFIPFSFTVSVLDEYTIEIPFHLTLFGTGFADLSVSATNVSLEKNTFVF